MSREKSNKKNESFGQGLSFNKNLHFLFFNCSSIIISKTLFFVAETRNGLSMPFSLISLDFVLIENYFLFAVARHIRTNNLNNKASVILVRQHN